MILLVTKELQAEWLEFYYYPTIHALLLSIQIGSGINTASYSASIGDLFSGLKWPGREVDHLFPFNT
jgi:hypothetical protein